MNLIRYCTLIYTEALWEGSALINCAPYNLVEQAMLFTISWACPEQGRYLSLCSTIHQRSGSELDFKIKNGLFFIFTIAYFRMNEILNGHLKHVLMTPVRFRYEIIYFRKTVEYPLFSWLHSYCVSSCESCTPPKYPIFQ